MKKTIAVLAAAIVICVGVAFYLNSNNFKAGVTGKSTSSSSNLSSLQALSSNISSAESQSASSSLQSEIKDKNIDKIKAAINIDWKKYSIKKENDKKTIGGKTYSVYTIWDSDYQEGPLVLVDTDSGNVYTWTNSDSAPVSPEKDKAFDKTVHTITVTLTDSTMMSYIGTTKDGNQISFRRFGVELVNFKNIKMGDKVKIYYTGVIKGDDTSRAFITKLEKAS